ncbi:hypothetical protein Barb6XT_02074 [Bacteroidales bacterium Barb6XT]|nr:hypothetical protein Barb6XT_02074 [Bacteroidales bacterium Barb6XT]
MKIGHSYLIPISKKRAKPKVFRISQSALRGFFKRQLKASCILSSGKYFPQHKINSPNLLQSRIGVDSLPSQLSEKTGIFIIQSYKILSHETGKF